MPAACRLRRGSRMPALADLRQHRGHHRPQACPGRDIVGIVLGEQPVCPFDKGPDTIGADIPVCTVEFSGAGDPKAISPKSAGHDLGSIVEETDPGCRRLRPNRLKMDGDRVALDRVDIDPVAQLACQPPTAHAGADHHCVEHVLSALRVVLHIPFERYRSSIQL